MLQGAHERGCGTHGHPSIRPAGKGSPDGNRGGVEGGRLINRHLQALARLVLSRKRRNYSVVLERGCEVALVLGVR